VEACVLRFRPIMMTTAAALLGSLPLVLERGTGSELRWPLGVAIVGGLLLSQAITLVHHAVDLCGVRAFAAAPAVAYALALAENGQGRMKRFFLKKRSKNFCAAL
jgi:hypothetical protein